LDDLRETPSDQWTIRDGNANNCCAAAGSITIAPPSIRTRSPLPQPFTESEYPEDFVVRLDEELTQVPGYGDKKYWTRGKRKFDQCTTNRITKILTNLSHARFLL